jgi:glycosyltransferase involved in cell wall biosynthesis
MKNNLKIIFFIYSLKSGGAERVTSLLANYWTEKGWDVAIVTQAPISADFYVLNKAVLRQSIELSRDSNSIVSAVINNIKRIYMYRGILKSQRPDIVISMMTVENVLLPISAIGMNIPIIGSERNYPPLLPLGKLWSALRRATYPYLDAMVAQTEKIISWLSENAPSPIIKKIPNPILMPLGRSEPFVDPDVFLSRIGTDKKVFLAVGRLEPQKGFHRLVDAFAEAVKVNSDWILVIVGGGSLRDSLIKQISEKVIAEKIFLAGSVGNAGDWYSKASAYVMSSHFEGFPNTLLEAMAHGLPCISTDCDTGPSELIVNDLNGMLVTNGSHASMVNGLVKLMNDHELRMRLGNAAKNVVEKYSMQSVSSEWENLIVDLTSSRKNNLSLGT